MSAPASLQRIRDLLVTFEPDGAVMLRSSSSSLGAKAHPFAVAVLAMCSEPTTREAIAQAGGKQAAQLFDQLARLGFLRPPAEAEDTPVMFGNFAGIEVHRRMLSDELRLTAYREALKAVVRPGDVVIDAGTGSGILAVYAALAGAEKVYGVELTELAQVARVVAEDSGVGDRVELVQADFRKVQLPRKARVLVTETFGSWVLAEGAREDLSACARANLQEDAVTIPQGFSLYLAPMLEAPYELLEALRAREDGVNLTCLQREARGRASIQAVGAEKVGEAALVGTFPLLAPAGETRLEGQVTLQGPCQALCAWFVLHLAPGMDLSTAPDAPLTHWKQTVLPVSLPEGRHTLNLRLMPAPEDRRTLLVRLSGAVQQDVRLR